MEKSKGVNYMNYKAIIITKTNNVEFGSHSKELLLARVMREVKKFNDDETITLSTWIKGYINGKERFTPCYPCKFMSEDFTKKELVKKLKTYFNSLLDIESY
jgi:hypothetical protein